MLNYLLAIFFSLHCVAPFHYEFSDDPGIQDSQKWDHLRCLDESEDRIPVLVKPSLRRNSLLFLQFIPIEALFSWTETSDGRVTFRRADLTSIINETNLLTAVHLFANGSELSDDAKCIISNSINSLSLESSRVTEDFRSNNLFLLKLEPELSFRDLMQLEEEESHSVYSSKVREISIKRLPKCLQKFEWNEGDPNQILRFSLMSGDRNKAGDQRMSPTQIAGLTTGIVMAILLLWALHCCISSTPGLGRPITWTYHRRRFTYSHL